MKLLIFDTETTSLKPGHICQLSYITIDASTKPQITRGNNIFFTVDEMDPAAEAIHGFSLEKLYEISGGMYFEDLYEDFIKDFEEADYVIGHNVNFDIRFLKSELEGLGIDFSPKQTFCTMQYYNKICAIKKANGDLKNPKLEEVIKFLKITKNQIASKADELFQGSGDYHDARFDTTATYLLIIEGLKQGFIPKGYFSSNLIGK
jgi:DNA polymerase-3 subunit epsilon